jgi:hypothetical protein
MCLVPGLGVTSDNRHEFAKRLHADVLRSSLSAEKRIKKFKEPAWSIELAEARKKVSILSKALSMAKTRINNVGILQQEMSNLSSPILFPETIQECSAELRNAKLELPKCVYQLISWTFKSDGSPFMKGYDTMHKVTVHDKSSNTRQEIPGISAYSAHKTLGHHKDPDGNQTKQRRKLARKQMQTGNRIHGK